MMDRITQNEEPAPLVSVIIPAKNESRWLPLCLDALLCENARTGNIEIIVVDNGSTDNTVEIAQQKGARVLYEPTLNISGMRNCGASHAKGLLLGFVDADVVVSDGWLDAALDCLETDLTIGCVGSFPKVPEGFGWVAQSWWYLQTPIKNEVTSNFEIEWLPSMNIIVRKEAFDRVAGFRKELITCEDVDLCYRLLEKYKILHCGNMNAVHYGEAKSLSHLFRKERWRGLHNYAGIRYHGLKKSEILSLLLPLFYSALCLVLVISLVTFKWLIALFAMLAALGGPLLKAFLSVRRFGNYQMIPKMTLVYLVYCVARTFGAFDWICSILSR